MDKAELLTEFKARVDHFAKFHGFIEKTRQQAEKFAPAVVERVISDNTEKRDAVVGELIPLTADMDGVIADLERERQDILDGQKGSRLALEEMDLRKTIGELTEEEFDAKSADLRAELAKGDEAVAGIDEELERFRAEMGRWQEIGDEAGVLSTDGEGEAPAEEISEIESVDILEPDADLEAEEIDVADVDMSGFEEASEEGVRFEQVNQIDDVSMVFADEEENGSAAAAVKLEVGDLDTLVDEDLESVEEEPGDERPRRAVMLYQEGTAEEQIHPFTGDVLTLGRGRDNDIQVKNDSKVSRYHCKLYRKNGNFYIEDLKSANGSLVNGELITERRLFGGEEIIIGETFFRFRIMD